jgi:hypothetical protein
MVWRFGQAVGDSDLSGFGAWLLERERYGNTINQTFHRTRELFDLQSLKSIAAAKKVFHKNKQTWLPQLQLMAARQPNDLFVAAHGGNNGESHNHNDVGDFIIYYAGDPVIIDVGSGTYTAKTFSSERYSLWFNTSAFHNLPTVNGQQQAEGSSFAASGVSYTVDKARTVLSMNIENAYPEMAGLAAWKRMITSAAAGVTIEDDFKAVKPLSSLTQSFMTVCEAELSKPGTIVFTTAHGHKVQLNYGDQWMASKETMPLVTEDELGLKVTWQDQRITRILLTLRSPLPNGHFKYVISSAPNK